MSKVPQSTDESEPGDGPVEELRPTRPLRRALVVVLSLIVVLVAGGGWLYWRATTASISLGFISGRVEAALRERLPPDSRLAVGSTAVSYREGQGVILRIEDLHLLLPGIADVAAEDVATRTTASALLHGRIDLQSVTASGLSIGVATPPHVAHDGSTVDLLRRASKTMMDQAVKADTLIREIGLQEVVVRDAAIRLDDQDGKPTGAPLHIAEANWAPLGADRSKVWMQILEADGHDWDMTLERRTLGNGESSVSAEVEDLPLATLAPKLAGGGDGPYFRSTVTVQARMAEAADGSFLGLRGIVSTADGQLSLTGVEAVNVETIALNFVLDPTGDRITVPNGEIRTRAGRARFEGVADFTEPGHVTLLARVRDGTLPTPIGDKKAVQLIGGGGMARLSFADLGIEVQQFSLMTPDGTASIIGQASLAGANPGLSFALSLTQMPAAVMRALWPPFVVTKTRAWFDINVKGGSLGPATLQVALPPDHIGARGRGKVLPDTALVGTVPFKDAEFSPIGTFPTIRNSTGGITFGNATASVWAQTGVVQVAGKGDVQAGGTTLIIPELGRAQPRGDLHLELAGSAAALAAVSNTPPLSVAAKQGVLPDSLSGDASLSLDASIPMYESNFADVVPTFRLGLSGFSSATPINGRMIASADLVLEGNPKSYTVKGKGNLDGLDATVDLILGAGAPETSAVSIRLDDDTRERLGFGLGNLVTGPMLAAVTHPDDARQQIAIDLKQSRISLPFLGWEKGPGVPATASFLMEKTSTGREITNFQLSGKGFEARGTLSFGLDGRLRAMDLEKLALRPGDQLSVSAAANGGGYDVKVRGSALDARGILQGVRSGVGGGAADIFPIAMSLNIDVVTGQNSVALSNIAGTLKITKKGLDAASLKGKSNNDQPFEWTLGHEGDTRVLRLFADGGGALIRFAGIYSRIAGGNLILDYSGPVGGAGTGMVVMRDFRLLNETALKPAVATTNAAMPRGGVAQANAEATSDLQFSQLKIPFRQEDWVITVNDAALRGSALGATASGTVNLPGGKIAISGAFIPAFGINNIAGGIPILGGLFGGRNEGLFGVTYRLFGPLDSPQLTMNPISALAPGIFRRIFEYR